jgi:hypothetical protein
MEEFGSHSTCFNEILYLSIFRKSIQIIQVSLKSEKNKGYCTWTPVYSLIVSRSFFFSCLDDRESSISKWRWDRLDAATSSSQCTRLTTRLSSITTTINRTENHRQWNAVRPPDDGRKDARNMLRINWLRINHYLLHLVGLTFIYISRSIALRMRNMSDKTCRENLNILFSVNFFVKIVRFMR